MRLLSLVGIAALSTMLVVGCATETDESNGSNDKGSSSETMKGDLGDDGVLGDEPIVGSDDSDSANGEVRSGATAATAGGKLRTTGDVNLRKGAGTTFDVLAVIPKDTIVTVGSAPSANGFFNVEYNGVLGWSSGKYLIEIDTTSPDDIDVDINGPQSPANTIARSKAVVGFSYYWGGGAWLEEGPNASTKGSCSGSCPSCSHSGKYGADCSGLVAKAWQFGDKVLSVNSHPYSTVSFNSDVAGKWSTVKRESLKSGDALVYNSGGAGHIVVYEKGDGWGQPQVYECRGCSYGCVYNARNFGSQYHAIRRAGF